MKFQCQNCRKEFNLSFFKSFKFRKKCPNCGWVSSGFLIADFRTLIEIVLLAVFLVVIFWVLFPRSSYRDIVIPSAFAAGITGSIIALSVALAFGISDLRKVKRKNLKYRSIKYSITTNIKIGYKVWKKTGFKQTILYFLLTIFNMIFSFLIVLFAIIIVLNLPSTQNGHIEELTDLIDLLIQNQLIWPILLLFWIIIVVLNTVIIGLIMNTAHEYTRSGLVSYINSLKIITSGFIPLSIVGIVMTSTIIIPIIVINLILPPKPLYNSEMIFTPFPGPPSIDFKYTFNLSSYLSLGLNFILILFLLPPYFLSVSAVINGEKNGVKALKEGWIKYLENIEASIIYLSFIICFILPIVIFNIVFAIIGTIIIEDLWIKLFADPIKNFGYILIIAFSEILVWCIVFTLLLTIIYVYYRSLD